MIPRLLTCYALAGGLAAQYSRGVNLAGAEFGENRIPGVMNSDYTYNSEKSFHYFAAKSLPLMRIPIRWERIQPVRSGPLDAAYLAALKRNVAWARAHGNLVIIDIHNYGRYKINEGGTLREYIIDNSYDGVVKVSGADFADLWIRLSREFQSEPAVFAYDLMNEPHDMGAANWKLISQTALAAIRNNGDNKLVMVPGNNWSAAHTWASVHGPIGWISDPADNFAYEAHQYFDGDNSGSYKLSYDEELKANPNLENLGQTRLAPFVEWCRNNRVRGYLGEYGVPNTDARWYVALDRFLAALDDAGFDGTYWAAGEWWGNYSLSVQPAAGFTGDRPQLATLQAHLAPRALSSVSAASGGGITFAPDSLVAGYGRDLGSEVELTDSTGDKVLAPILAAAPSQINYLVPAGMALGRVDVVVRKEGEVTGLGTLWLERVAPSLFPAGSVLRVQADGSQSLASLDQPIVFGDPSEHLFLILYGTGFRNLVPESASLQIGATPLSISYAGRQPDIPGLDQVNAELPRSLAGAGALTVLFQVEGKAANPLILRFQ